MMMMALGGKPTSAEDHLAGSGPSFLVPRSQNARVEAVIKEKQEKEEEQVERQNEIGDNFRRRVYAAS